MGFYDKIAEGLSWEYTSERNLYLTVSNGSLLLPKTGWLAYNLRYLDNVIEAIHAFRHGQLADNAFDIETIETKIVKTPEEGIEAIDYLEKNYKVFAIDIETDNLSTDKKQNHLLSVGIAYEDTKSFVFLKECFLDKKFRLKFQLFVLKTDFCFIYHNCVFDVSRLRIIEDFTLNINEDTLLKHYTGINEHKGTHGLKNLAQLYLGFPDWEKALDDWKRAFCRANKIKLGDFKFSYYPTEMLAKYNGIDCCATFQLNKRFDNLVRENSKYIYKKLIEAAPFYVDMIVRGMKLDINYWKQLADNLTAEKKALEEKLAVEMPGVLLTSPKQMKEWLSTEFPDEYIETTGAKEIGRLSKKYPKKESLKNILKFRKVDKYLKTYVDGLWKRKDYQNVIHCEYKLHGTETGRLSSANPNMQNIPRSSLIKSLFIAREGYTFLQLDYSQLELRVLAHISNDETLIKCFKDGRDLHSEMQRKIFKEDTVEEDQDQRMVAKILNFGIAYGRTAAGVADELDIDLPTAKRYLREWHAGAPQVKDYIKKCQEMALADPQEVYYTVFGRARHYFVTSQKAVFHTENQAVNFPVSSTANDLTIHALVEIGKWLQRTGADAYLVNTVHDSIILEVRPEEAKAIAEKCMQIMTEIPPKYLLDTEVPFKVDAEIGDCWGNLRSLEVEEYD